MATSHFPLFIFLLGFILLLPSPLLTVESSCSKGCDLALASYFVWDDASIGFANNLSFVSSLFGGADMDEIIRFSPPRTTKDFILTGSRLLVPFQCDCVNQTFLGHSFKYAVKRGDTYNLITRYYFNLTTPQLLQEFGNSSSNQIGVGSGSLNVVVNCSCGNKSVSDLYGLFATYPLLPGETLKSVAKASNLSENLLQNFNPGKNFGSGSGLVYIPAKDLNGSYRPLVTPKNGLPGGAVVGISVGAVIIVILMAVGFYIGIHKKRRVKNAMLLSTSSFQDHSNHAPNGASSQTTGFTVNKSVEFSYEELSTATNNFNLANKIGQGGFGSVYYAELRGEKAAIKKMDMQASKEFLAELKVLTNVHHLNLVRLIGYCVEDFLFVVYEYIENGNLSQHLRGSGNEPLTWSSRVQIALDSARGLEYIHEHTVPVYIHRDIKSANILIDKGFHGKVADFGLTKLTDVGNASRPTHLVGTFGYMPPEYARYGDVSPKVDVFAFGVVLFELISAKEAIIRTPIVGSDSTTLVALFHEIFEQPDPKDGLRKVIDAKLGNDYLFDSVWMIAELAKACTEDNPLDRPTMRSVVVALMTAHSPSTEEWDVVSFYENQALVDLMSSR